MGNRQKGSEVTQGEIQLSLAVVESIHLAELIEQFTSMLSDPRASSDPGIQRLTPEVYPDDAEGSAEFAIATRDDLIDRRRADAAIVTHALTPLLSPSAEDPTGSDAIEEGEIHIPARELDAWLRTLTALRLVIATRLRIAEDDDHDVEDPRFGVYDWLGYRLDQLVVIADAHDGDSA